MQYDTKIIVVTAPGSYAPEKSLLSQAAPSYSFGLKIDDSKPNGVPGK